MPPAAKPCYFPIGGGTTAAACSCFVATAFLAAFRFLVFATRLRTDFSFLFRIAFFAADLLPLGMGIPFAPIRGAVAVALIIPK